MASKGRKKAGGAKKGAATKPVARKAGAKKGAATKPVARKAGAKKGAAKKPVARKAGAKKRAEVRPSEKMAGSKAPEQAAKGTGRAKKRAASWRTVPEPKAATAAGRSPAPSEDGGFEPRIVAFACNWCSYPAADAAGISKMQYPPNARIIRVMCAGRVHPAFVLRALELGADGVLVSGCHFEDCHYLFGARRAAEAFDKTAELVRLLGLERERVRYEQISAAEAPKFARVMQEFVGDIKKIGPSPLAGAARGRLTVPDAVTDEVT